MHTSSISVKGSLFIYVSNCLHGRGGHGSIHSLINMIKAYDLLVMITLLLIHLYAHNTVCT